MFDSTMMESWLSFSVQEATEQCFSIPLWAGDEANNDIATMPIMQVKDRN